MTTIGVTVQLDGAASYKKQMSDITNQTKMYQAEVKKLTTEINNGNNVYQNRIARGEALEKQLASQREQEKLLLDQIDKMTDKYGENSSQVIRLKTQYENLQTAISNTEKSISDNGDKWTALSEQIGAVGGKLTDIGDKISSVGDTMTKGLTVPIVGVGAASVAAFNDVDAGLDTVASKTGATGDALEGMEDIVKDLAKTIPTTFEKAGSAVGEVNTRFGLTGDALEDLSGKFIKFADLNNTDVSNSIDQVQSLMAAFNIDASEAGTVLDILNKAGQDTGISIDTLTNSLFTNAAALTEMGYDLNTATAFIANLEKNGVDTSATMTGLKKAFQNSAAEGKSMSDTIAELETTLKSGDTTTEAYQQAMELFGNRAGPALAKALSEGKISLDELANSVDDYGDSVETTFETTKDPIDDFTTNMNKLKLVGTDLVTSAAPLITSAMEKMGNVIEKVSEFWNGLDDDTQQFIINAALVVAAVGPILSVIGTLVSTIGTIATGISTVMSWGPAITAAGTAISTFFTGTLLPAITSIGTFITATIIPAITGVITALAPFLPIIAAVAAGIAILVVVIKNWGAISDWISEKWELVTTFISEKVSALQTFLTEHFGIIGEYISAKIEFIKIVIETAFNVIKIIVQTVMAIVKAIINGDWNQIGAIISAAWEAIKATISGAAERVKSLISGLMESVKSSISNAWENVKNSFVNAKNSVVSTVQNLVSAVGDKISSLGSSAMQWGKDLIDNFVQGIKNNIAKVGDAVKGVADKVKSFLGFSEPSDGPLKSFHTFGRDMMENYATSIENAQYLVRNAVDDVAADVAVLDQPFSYSDLYDAVRRGASDSDTNIYLNDREITRALSGLGVSFNG